MRLIDADKLKYKAETCIETTDAFIELIESMPEEVAPIVYGEWIVDNDIHCSKCGNKIADFIPNPTDAVALILDNRFCSWCGAKMKEGDSNDT